MMGSDRARAMMARYAPYILWAHVPVIAMSGWAANAEVDATLVGISALLALAAHLVAKLRGDADVTLHIIAIAFMAQIALIVASLEGHPWQLDMHMYFFAGLAMLAFALHFPSLITATAFIAVHHLALNFLLPELVYPGGASLGRVVLHAGIVILEVSVLIALVRLTNAAFAESAAETARAEAASQAQREAEIEAQQIRAEAARREAEQRNTLANDFEQGAGNATEMLSDGATNVGEAVEAIVAAAVSVTHATIAAADSVATAQESIESAATAGEELAASSRAIHENADASKSIVAQAVQETRETEKLVGQMQTAADEIGAIVAIISEIAEQTNLLALNATIESARAGEAGRGFAVVASEVKTLATQTTEATENIGQRIASIVAITRDCVAAVGRVSEIIEHVNGYSTSIGGAIAEQTEATSEIARSMTSASHSAADVTAKMDSILENAQTTELTAQSIRQTLDRLRDAREALDRETSAFLTVVREAA